MNIINISINNNGTTTTTKHHYAAASKKLEGNRKTIMGSRDASNNKAPKVIKLQINE